VEVIKPIIRVGNSAGVILPREWLNGEAKVTLIKRPRDIKQDVLDILWDELSSITGLYLVGSYARGEQNEKSDIDILGVTEDTNRKIKKGKYDIVLISYETLEKSLKDNILPLLPMLREASPITNKNLLNRYKDYPITFNNLQWHIDTTASALKIIKKSIELAKEKDEKVSDNVIYSLVLRLREAYIVDCLIKNKVANNKELRRLIIKLAGSINAYESYHRSKLRVTTQRKVDVGEAESLQIYLSNIIDEQKKWIKRKG